VKGETGDSDLLAGRYFEDKLSFWFVATGLMRPLGASLDSNTDVNSKKLRLTVLVTRYSTKCATLHLPQKIRFSHARARACQSRREL